MQELTMNCDDLTVAYLRESTMKQVDDGYGIDAQEEKISQWQKLNDIKNLYILREEGQSAKTTNRKQMNILKQMIKAGKVKRVVVYKLDRLVRRLKGLAEMMELFQEYHVDFVSIKENFDSRTPIGRMMINFTVMLAEWEQDTISERTKETMHYAASIGSYVKGGRVDFGYLRKKDKVDEKNMIRLVKVKKEIDIVKKIFGYANDGISKTQIALMINQEPYCIEKKIVFTDDTIENLLSNRIYIGIMKFGDKEYTIKNARIFSDKYFEQVQINRSIHSKEHLKYDYPYKKKVYCNCGTRCVVDVTVKRQRGKIIRYFYYVCPICKKRINQKVIEEYVDPRLEKRYAKMKERNIREKIDVRYARLERLKDRVYMVFMQGKITEELYVEQLERIERDKKMIEHAKDKIENRSGLRYKHYKQNYIEMLVDKIRVDMDTKNIQVSFS